jgi:hypothetical protein
MYFIHGIYSGYNQKENEFHLVDHNYNKNEGYILSSWDSIIYYR